MIGESGQIGGIVLCGGRSRRMGTAKAWLRYGDEYGLQRVVRIVGEVVRPVVVAGREDIALPPVPAGARVVHDAPEYAGPLAGMAAGFAALAGACEAVFVASCDVPLLRPAVVRKLIELLGDRSAVVPRHGGRLQPLTAVYRLSTAGLLRELLNAGERRAQVFAERCGDVLVETESFRDLDAEGVSFWNVNDQAEYEAVLRIVEEEANRGGREGRAG